MRADRATSPRSLVLLRHGRTAWNATGTAQGHADVPLDETGHAQAAAVAPVLAGLAPTRLWTSDLARAAQTAAYVAKACGLEPVVDPRLREYDVGERTGLTLAEFARKYPEEHEAWLAGNEAMQVPGAESTSQVRARVVPALVECWDALAAGGTGVVVMHGACLRVGLAGLLGWPWEAVDDTLGGIANCGWAVLLSGRGDGPPRLAAYNRTAAPGGDFVPDAPVG